MGNVDDYSDPVAGAGEDGDDGQQGLATLHLVSIIAISMLKFAGGKPLMPNNRSRTETVVHADPTEADRFSALRDKVDAVFSGPQAPYLLAPDGERMELPDSAFEALKLVIDTLARGQSITLVPHEAELTSQGAADMLNVSRPHLIKLLDHAELPFRRVGSHRRIKIEDVLAYRERRNAERDAALSELTRLSEELPGGYR